MCALVIAARRAMALEEAAEVLRRDGPPLGDLDRLEELPEAQEVDVLVAVLVAVREVERRGALGEERRLRHVEHVARDRTQACVSVSAVFPLPAQPTRIIGRGSAWSSACRSSNENRLVE